MDNDLRNCPSHSSRPICTPSDAPRCHHVPTNTFFLFFFNPKNTVQLSFIPIFQAILPLSFVFSHISCPFIQFQYYPVLSRKRKKVKWTGTESFDRLKNNPLVELWKSNVQDLRIKISVVRSSIARIQWVIKWEETNQTGWLLVPIIKAAKIANQLS